MRTGTIFLSHYLPGFGSKDVRPASMIFFLQWSSREQHVFLLITPNLGLIRALEARTEIIYRHLSEVFSDILPPKRP